jgi:DNA (cytosine-5)-methyltransferase 1
VKPGGNYNDIPDDVPSERIKRLKREGGHTTCYGRLSPDKPAHTINTYFNRPNVGCNIHYEYDRLLTIREALRFQTFPDTYQLVCKSKTAKHLIVGNAVPPILAYALAKQLRKYL